MKTLDEITEPIGKRFGKLTVIGFSRRDKRYNYRYICKCDCGNIKEVVLSNLLRGNTTSCGCSGRGISKNLVGQRFGRLTVLEKTNKRYYGYTVWKCVCDCGNIVEVPMHNLSYNHMVKSCGCMLDENRKKFSNHNNIRYVIQFENGSYYTGKNNKYWFYDDNIQKASKFPYIKSLLKRAEWLKTEYGLSYKIVPINT